MEDVTKGLWRLIIKCEKHTLNSGFMKRLNPDTGKPFKIGDVRPASDIQDGKVFGGYYTSLYKEIPEKGEYFEEFWVEENKLDS